MTCKECYHYDACAGYLPSDLDKDVFDYCAKGIADEIPDIEERCSSFKDKSSVLEPPCKVGDVVYLIKDGFVERCEVEGIHYTRRRNYVRIRPFHQEYIGNWSVYYTPSIRSFGKTVFCNRKDAEEVAKNGR